MILEITGIDWVDISATVGLCAMSLLTFNLLLGMIISTAYKRSVIWNRLPGPVKKINLLDLHNWTAYVALVLALTHPLLLLVDKNTKFRLTDIVFPLHAPHQPLWIIPGALALYAVIVVVITTQKIVKKKMSFRAWKNIHLISYGTALLFLVHGLMMDPELKDRPIDWLDGEKLLCESCGVILIAASIARYNYFLKNSKQK